MVYKLPPHWSSAKGNQKRCEAAETGKGKQRARKPLSPSAHTYSLKSASANPNPKEVSLATCLHPVYTAFGQHTLLGYRSYRKVVINVRRKH